MKYWGVSLTEMYPVWWWVHGLHSLNLRTSLYVGYISTNLLKNSNKIPRLQGPGAWDCEWRRWNFLPIQVHWFCTESERNNQVSALWHSLWKRATRLWLFIYCVWKLRMTLIKFQDTYLLSMCYYVLIVKSVQRWWRSKAFRVCQGNGQLRNPNEPIPMTRLHLLGLASVLLFFQGLYNAGSQEAS